MRLYSFPIGILSLFILTSCGTGLCPLKASTTTCIVGTSGPYGILDLSFGVNGQIYGGPQNSGSANGYSAVIQNSGKILIIGDRSAPADASASRFTSNGILDSSLFQI